MTADGSIIIETEIDDKKAQQELMRESGMTDGTIMGAFLMPHRNAVWWWSW